MSTPGEIVAEGLRLYEAWELARGEDIERTHDEFHCWLGNHGAALLRLAEAAWVAEPVLAAMEPPTGNDGLAACLVHAQRELGAAVVNLAGDGSLGPPTHAFPPAVDEDVALLRQVLSYGAIVEELAREMRRQDAQGHEPYPLLARKREGAIREAAVLLRQVARL